ncbi:MAG TPA: hypothetical protein PL182_12855 [Pseudobdellovibrionaceae bacterium]|nr:hypothetical protein [Pseudobdellovibrionaceae bacterium]
MNRKKIEALGFAEHPDRVWWAYGDEEFSLRRDPSQVYLERPAYGCRGAIGTLREESFRAARMISERHGKPILLYSGGIDSEAILLSFHLQKLPYEVVIFDFGGINREDADKAMAFCGKLGAKARFLTLDIRRFWENDLESVAKSIHCTSPQIAALCWGISKLDEYVVVGDGDSSLIRAGQYFFEMKSERWALARWMMSQGKSGCPRFYQYTAELEASIYFDPLVEQFVQEEMSHFLGFRKIRYLKPFVFHRHFDCRLREKRTGFESVEEDETYRNYRRALIAMLGLPHEISWTYDHARNWATASQAPRAWVPLEASPYPERDKESLSQIGSGVHSQWVE